MSGHDHRQPTDLTCAECMDRLPLYVDEGLDRADSMPVFLHLRDCAACGAELARQQRLHGLLTGLPEREPPADFDARILASVPYQQYRDMAELRRPRVAVLLDRETMPAWVRSPAVRTAGAVVAAAAIAGRLGGVLPDAGLAVAVIGLLPEALLTLQALGRRLLPAGQRAGKGA